MWELLALAVVFLCPRTWVLTETLGTFCPMGTVQRSSLNTNHTASLFNSKIEETSYQSCNKYEVVSSKSWHASAFLYYLFLLFLYFLHVLAFLCFCSFCIFCSFAFFGFYIFCISICRLGGIFVFLVFLNFYSFYFWSFGLLRFYSIFLFD